MSQILKALNIDGCHLVENSDSELSVEKYKDQELHFILARQNLKNG